MPLQPTRCLPKATNIVLLPTTAGTGAEVTRTAVFCQLSNIVRVWAWGHELVADLVILDPELTLTLPESLTAATGLDAMVHAIEACTVKKSHPHGPLIRHCMPYGWGFKILRKPLSTRRI